MNGPYRRGDVFRIRFLDNETLQTIKKADNIAEDDLILGGVYLATFKAYHADQELIDFSILGNKDQLIQVRIKKSEIDNKRISAKCVWKCHNCLSVKHLQKEDKSNEKIFRHDAGGRD